MTLLKNLLKKARYPIAIDFGMQHIRMLQIDGRPGSLTAIAAACEPMPKNLPSDSGQRVEAIAQVLRRMLASATFRGRKCIACLPASEVMYKNLRIPKMPPNEMKAAVEWEAADRLNFNNDTMSLRFYDAGEVSQGEEQREEVILLAATKQVVDEHAAAMVAAGLQPSCVESVPCALNRIAMQTLSSQSDEDVQVILDVGYSASKVLISRQGRIMFFKLIEIGGKHLDERVAKHLGLDISEASDVRRRAISTVEQVEGGEENQSKFGETRRDNLDRAIAESLRSTVDELAKEVSLCLRYFSVTFRGRRPESVWLAGGESTEPQVAKLLSEGAGIRVSPLSLDGYVDCAAVAETIRGLHGSWATAAGLAMWTPPLTTQRRGAA